VIKIKKPTDSKIFQIPSGVVRLGGAVDDAGQKVQGGSVLASGSGLLMKRKCVFNLKLMCEITKGRFSSLYSNRCVAPDPTEKNMLQKNVHI
jgi:hypothetical protein